MPSIVYLGLGTNQGDRLNHIRAAISHFHPQLRLLHLSPLYETDPWGYEDQPDFLNLVAKVETDLSPGELLDYVKDIEDEMGRQETFRYGPRIIDIDILFFDDLVIDHDRVHIPHPRIEGRAFVLVPLADLSEDLIHPVSGDTVSDMLKGLDTKGVRPYRRDAQPAPPEDAGQVWRESMRIGPMQVGWGERTLVMGILNVTPDSFSGDGLLTGEIFVESALSRARQFKAAGADILDVGGESTRPGSEPIDAETEAGRVLPVISAIAGEMDIAISIDSYKADVAEAALLAGAHMVNDVWALRADPEMRHVAASFQVPIILMHNRSDPSNAQVRERLGGRYVGVDYEDLIADVKRELMESVEIARAAGIGDQQIILDPGIGFGKTVEQNLTLINQLDRIGDLGYPLLLGPSRKSFIGYTLDLPPDERVEGTGAAVAVGVTRGADIVRVHDVEQMVRVTRMTDAIVRR
jgi:dihydropteroate synthase/2-amino-4-hydroxy-6-hydroxymethyldihydropteridine diphosphokinase